jgi:hypothetical protein
VNISSSVFSLGPEECVLPGSVNEPDSFYNQYEKEFSMHVEQYYTQNILYIN